MQGKTSSCSLVGAFIKLVIPLWLKELAPLPVAVPLAGEAVPAASAAGADPRPRKVAKTTAEKAEAANKRSEALPQLDSSLFQPQLVQSREGRTGRTADGRPHFLHFVCPTSKEQRQAARAEWEQAGHGDLFELFHPRGLKRGLTFKQYVSRTHRGYSLAP